MMRGKETRDVRPIRLISPGPGVVQLEDDNRAPLLSIEQRLIMALDRAGRLEARLANAELISGHLASVSAALVMILEREPTTSHLVQNGMVVLPAEITRRSEGAQIEAIQTSDGDVGIVLRERAPELLLKRGA